MGRITRVVKRNNDIVSFDSTKIASAINKAFKSQELSNNEQEFLTSKILETLDKKYHSKTIPAVEDVQDIVENVLMKHAPGNVAKAYILYRDKQHKLRDGNKLLLNINNTMDGYLKQSDWRVNENSNVNYSLGGLILHNSGTVTANYWLNNIYTKEFAEAHKCGELHCHDLSMFSGYCAGWSLKDLILKGLGGVDGKISSKPPKHLSTLVNQMINFLGTMQNEWAGAQAFSSFDTYLSSFVKNENLTYKQVKQNIQSFVFAMNTPSRWGSQPVFSNLTLDWVVPDNLKSNAVTIGGKEQSFTYGDCQEEMNMINKAFLEVMKEGDANGRGFSYPIPTYNLTKDFDWDNENSNLLFEMTGKYGTPYFQNFINSDLDPESIRSMCCRLSLNKKELLKRGGGLFGADELTGSIGVVTINLPRIGYLTKTKEEFFSKLKSLMNLAKNSLETKRKVVNTLNKQGLFPYTKRYLKNFNNHFSTIGINGMHECCLNFMGKSIASEEGKNFAGEVLDFMRNRLVKYQEDTGNLYNLEATLAEGTSYRLAKIDKENYPDIITSGNEEPYYTNSTQLPVGYTDDIFEALDLQDELQTKYTGGTVFHGFIGETIDDPETCKSLVRKIATNYQLPYFSITPTFSVCEEHGRMSGEHFTCPKCQKDCEVYSRIVGYYRPISNWNKGKKSEYKERTEFTLDKVSGPEKEDPISFTMFYSPKCGKCPPLKEYLQASNLHGVFTNVVTDEGLKEAEKLSVQSLPTVVLFKGGEILKCVHTVEELENTIGEIE